MCRIDADVSAFVGGSVHLNLRRVASGSCQGREFLTRTGTNSSEKDAINTKIISNPKAVTPLPRSGQGIGVEEGGRGRLGGGHEELGAVLSSSLLRCQ